MEPTSETPAATPVDDAAAFPAPAMVMKYYKGEIRTLAIIVVAMLLAAGISLRTSSTDDGSLYLTDSLSSNASPTTTTTVVGKKAAPAAPQIFALPGIPAQQSPTVVVINGTPTAGTSGKTASSAGSTSSRYDNGPALPLARIDSVSPSNPAPNANVEVRFTAGDADGVVAAWRIDWGDGNSSYDTYDPRCGPPPGEADHQFPSASHAYSQMGSYSIVLTVVSRGTCGAGPSQHGTDNRKINVSVVPGAPATGL